MTVLSSYSHLIGHHCRYGHEMVLSYPSLSLWRSNYAEEKHPSADTRAPTTLPLQRNQSNRLQYVHKPAHMEIILSILICTLFHRTDELHQHSCTSLSFFSHLLSSHDPLNFPNLPKYLKHSLKNCK